jgi:hypothetical protein
LVLQGLEKFHVARVLAMGLKNAKPQIAITEMVFKATDNLSQIPSPMAYERSLKEIDPKRNMLFVIGDVAHECFQDIAS